MRRLGVGVLGCGGISNYHFPALVTVSEARLVAVCDPNKEKAEAAAHKYGAERWYVNHMDLLQDPEVEAVLVLTPNHTHRDLAIAAAGHKKHVMMQKPFARTVTEAQDMIAAAEKEGTQLIPSFMHRFIVETREAKRYFDAGYIGRPMSMRIRNGVPGATWSAWFYDAGLTGGGAVIDVGVHGIDLVRYFLGEIAEVSAYISTHQKERVLDDGSTVTLQAEDTAAISYRTQSGVLVSHEVSWCQKNGSRRFSLEIYGDEGTLYVRTALGPLAVASERTGGVSHWFVPDLPKEPFGHVQHRAFVRGVLGLDPPSLTPYDGLATIQVVEAVYRSAAERRPVAVASHGHNRR